MIMRYVITLLITLIFTCSINCAGLIKNDSIMYDGYKSDNINTFLKGFEEAVEHHDTQLVLKYIDKDYIDEQLYKNLEGRKDQFMNELFWGYFHDISDITLLIFPTGFENEIVNTDTLPYRVTFTDGTEKKIYLYIKKVNRWNRHYAIFSALG